MAKEVCSTKQHLEEEHQHLQKVLSSGKYPRWALNRMKKKISASIPINKNQNKDKKRTDNKTKTNTRSNYVTATYTRGLSESFKNIVRSMAYKFTLEEAKQSKTSWWHQKTKIL